ncbi:MAG TPA: NAD(P)-dependent alcohol dehydrogenase [Pyrinomonadaceae bacterium]|nr:NAD(P)-dependent alcohol dehydrogenase [Pyrinomonadaceae bacterium]
MKAYEIQQFGIENLALVDRETPEPNAKEVLVRIRAASLNFRDLMVATGTYNPRMKMPAVPLSDGAGEIVAVGDGVTKWKVGDRVIPIFAQRWIDGETSEEKRRTSLGAGAQWDGVLREFGAFDEEGLVSIPDHLSYEEASTLPCAGLTAWHALAVSGNLKAGHSVLTLGTGGVSIFALQLARMFGARVISTTGTAEKENRLRELGADEVINYRTREDWDAAVLELTQKKGVDHVIEVGGAGTLGKSLSSVRLGGHVAMIGALTGPGDFNPITVFMKAVRLQGIFVGSRTMFEEMLQAIAVSKLAPVIDRVFEFDEAREAMQYMQSGAHFGKVVIRV